MKNNSWQQLEDKAWKIFEEKLSDISRRYYLVPITNEIGTFYGIFDKSDEDRVLVRFIKDFNDSVRFEFASPHKFVRAIRDLCTYQCDILNAISSTRFLTLQPLEVGVEVEDDGIPQVNNIEEIQTPGKIEDLPGLKLEKSSGRGIKVEAHYNFSKMEAIEAIDACLNGIDFALGSALKYIWRCRHKGDPIKDLTKAINYIQHAIQLFKEGYDEEA